VLIPFMRPAARGIAGARLPTTSPGTTPPCPDSPPRPPTIDPLVLYAVGIDASDYVSRIVPLVQRMVPEIGDLLDIGAGAGQLGRALRRPGAAWTAVEPAAAMRSRLAGLGDARPRVVPHGWESASLAAKSHDTVLAANTSAPFQAPAAFLDRCRSWARRHVVWIVPAQHGPRGTCLSGCLPPEWHGEDERPGVDVVLSRLDPAQQPDAVVITPWTFVLPVGGIESLAEHLAERLAWAPHDPRRRALRAHLVAQCRHDARGSRLEVAKAAAVLVWRLA
jgi:hypothetical protein